MDATFIADPRMAGIGLLIARLVLGPLMAAHGTQKLFGWFGGYGLHTTGEFFVQLGFSRGRAFATAASVGEVVSGLLVTLGFLGPVGPALMIAIMLVAAISVHWEHGVPRRPGQRSQHERRLPGRLPAGVPATRERRSGRRATGVLERPKGQRCDARP